MQSADRAIGRALDCELRVDEQADALTLPIEFRRDGVDEERHVVGDDLQHRVTGGPSMGVDPRRETADEDFPGLPLSSQGEMTEDRTPDVVGMTGGEIFGEDMLVVGVDQLVRIDGIRFEAGRGLREEFVSSFVEDCHGASVLLES